MTTDSEPPYEDPDQPTEKRVTDLLGRMTPREKVGQLVGMCVGSFVDYRRGDVQESTISDVEDAIREFSIGSVTPFGTGVSTYNNTAVTGRLANRLQRIATTETRLEIPLLVPVDAIHGHANVKGGTIFPHNLGMAATWDSELVERVGRVTATELAATGANQNYSPTADVAREPRWGRTYETYGESPYLVGELVAAETAGLQGTDLGDPQSVAATVKHYPASGGPTRGEDTAPVDVSPETLCRVFLPPFERAFETGVSAVMPAYNAIGTQPVHASRQYLTGLLRDRLNFTGITCSDWLGVLMLVEHHRTASSFAEAVEQVTNAGLDVASVGGPQHARDLLELVEAGDIAEDTLDRRVRRVLGLKFDLGLFEDPYVAPERASRTLGTDAHREVALESAHQSMTLLENRDETLPLVGPDEVLVTGPNADSLDTLAGGWSVRGLDSTQGATIREAMAERTGDGVTVIHHRGVVDGTLHHIDRVTQAAESADAALVVLGENWYIHEFGPESISGPPEEFPKRNQLRVPDAQRRLLEAVHETGTPTVLVLVSGRPLVLTDLVAYADAILMAYLPGIEGGNAIADVVCGTHNPSGRLPISFPRTIGDLPVTHDWLPHPNPIGSREHPPSYDPLYEFGHGHSYTTFSYDSMEVSTTTLPPDGEVVVSVTVTNTGDRIGEEVVQLFVRDMATPVVTPVRELKAFEKLRIPSNRSETATFRFERPDVIGAPQRDGDTLEAGEISISIEEFSETISVE